MSLRGVAAAGLLLALACRAAGSALWPLGSGADARLVAGGWGYDAKAQCWVPEAEIRVVNRDAHRPFHRAVRVEFIGAGGRAWVWKTFVALAPGTAQHRRISAPGRLGFRGALADCPALGLRVDLSPRNLRDAVQPLPRIALEDPDAPPAGQPLYVSAVEEGAVLRLLDGRTVRPLGLRMAPGTAAADWTRRQVMDGPVRLEYDSLPPDRAGHWQAYVRLPDGRDLGAELLRRGLAVPDLRFRFSRGAAYRALEPRPSKAS